MMAEMEELVAAGETAFAEFVAEDCDLYHPLVHADYRHVARALAHLRPGAQRFLEWGSGVGTISIMADMFGYEAFGIERDARLVTRAEALAERFESRANFAVGSYVPSDLQDDPEFQNADFLTSTEGEPAYEELGERLADFDMIYAFPWPGEEELHLEIMRRCARPGSLLLLYASTDGIRLYQNGMLLDQQL